MSKPILSILILISNRPDTVKKCLDSIVPILERVPSELILTDTGCGEKVRGIIEKYNATIFDFEWCKDFAKARNVGLNAAKGDWFLFIDDDEWFENTDEIVEFFNSGEYNQYGFATYIQRNYHDWDGTNYFDFNATRIFKRYEGIQFMYAVHEQPNIVMGDKKYLGDFVHHYGYIHKSVADQKAHFERNKQLLEQEYEKDPLDQRVAIHYADCLRERDYRKTLEICKKLVDEFDGSDKELSIHKFIPTIVEMYYKMGDKAEATKYAKWALEKKLNNVLQAQICGIMTSVYLSDDKCSESLECARKFYNFYIDRYNYDYRQYLSLVSLPVFEKKNYSTVIQKGMIAALKSEDITDLTEWFESMKSDDFDEKVNFYDVDMINQLAKSFLSKTKSVSECAKSILNELNSNERMTPIVTKAIFEAADSAEELLKFACLEGSNAAISVAKMFSDNNIRFSFNEFKELWKLFDTVYVQIKKYELIDEFLDKIDLFKEHVNSLSFPEWNGGVYAVLKIVDSENTDRIVDMLIALAGEVEERAASVNYAHYKNQMLDLLTYKDLMLFERIDIIGGYAKAIEKRVKVFYSEYVLNDFEKFLSDDEIFGMKFIQITKCVNDGRFVDAIEIVRKMVSSDSHYLTHVKDITRWINESSIESGFAPEMYELAQNIKNKIRELKNNGDVEAAVETEKMLLEFYK